MTTATGLCGGSLSVKLDAAKAIHDIDAILAMYDAKQGSFGDSTIEERTMLSTLVMHCIDRFAPLNSQFRTRAAETTRTHDADNTFVLRVLAGILQSLRQAYSEGFLLTIEELIHSDLFGDFLGMAEHLLSEGYKDPAAVLIGGVLEEHLRQLATQNGIDVSDASRGEPKKASRLNDELKAGLVYSKLEHKNVTAWLDLRNNAAHGHYDQYDRAQVAHLLSQVRDFMVRHPA